MANSNAAILTFISSFFYSFLFCHGAAQYGTVYMTDGKASFKSGVLDKKGGVAYGTYNNSYLTTGWDVLDIKAGYATQGPRQLNQHVMYAAGFAEGYMTAQKITQYWQNIQSVWLNGKSKDFMANLYHFFEEQEKYALNRISQDAGRTPYWRHVGYVLAQMEGLYDGHKAALGTNDTLPRFAIVFLNGVGDYIDIQYAISREDRPDFKKMSHLQFKTFVESHGHCSALIKATGAYENIFMSHSSWFLYSSMLRIYKHYDFNINDAATVNKQMSFSSYPGFLESLDDFYLISNGLVMLQTTNNVFNMSLYDQVKPESILAWQRVRVAHMMSASAADWGRIFSMENSGTYNNQYMILDLNKIKIGKEIQDGALYVVEQIPTLVEYADQTNILRNGHWPSYNVPFYEKVYNMSGYPETVARRGLDYSYQMAPRAKIFRRDADKVTDMKSMMDIMRYNNYLKDPYSEGDACKAVCCRGDLSSTNPRADGCYDTKVSDYNMAWKRQSYAINGPTTGTGLKPFSWVPPFNDSHVGMPKTFDFKFEFMERGLN
ncbi:phospholipase B-like 1 [Lineus longissimus]|uniref:phospholipase B-like 1 n=1 Tax=Lineus longissimus TaxID=88925 RepID=UPI002B4E5AD6